MPIVTLLPSGHQVEVPEGTLLFDAACRAGLPVASSCSAEAVCGKCVMRVITGADQLNPISEYEKKILKRDHREPEERLSCMAKVEGNCSVQASYW